MCPVPVTGCKHPVQLPPQSHIEPDSMAQRTITYQMPAMGAAVQPSPSFSEHPGSSALPQCRPAFSSPLDAASCLHLKPVVAQSCHIPAT